MWKIEYVSRCYGLLWAPSLGLADLHHIEVKVGKISQVQDWKWIWWLHLELHPPTQSEYDTYLQTLNGLEFNVSLLSKHMHHSREKVMLVVSSNLVPNIPQVASL